MRWRVAILLAALLAAAGAVRAAEPVDLELVLAADGSGSIDDAEFKLQRRGYAEAITHPRVLAAIRGGFLGKIAIALIEWGAPESQATIVDWTVIEDEASARGFAAKLIAAPRVVFGYNSISNAIAYAADLIRTNAYAGTRKIVDLSGDGPQIGGAPLALVRHTTLQADITINALVIATLGSGYPGPSGEPLDVHYRNDVVGGPGHFVMIAESRERFAAAILNKLVLEIADRGGADPGRRPRVRIVSR